MGDWSCEHSISTSASREDAWAYWSDMQNHAKLEPGVERIELDGPFASGTPGRTIVAGVAQEWMLADVVDRRRFTVIGFTPDRAGSVSFAWEFEDDGTGTRLTQRIAAHGPEVEQHLQTFRQMEANAPKGLARLAVELDGLAGDEVPMKRQR
jgi:hypothetical protein